MFSPKAFTRFIFAAVLFSVSANISFANKTTDSLTTLLKSLPQDTTRVHVLGELAYEFASLNPDEAKARALEVLELSRKLNFAAGVAMGYSRLALVYKLLTNYDSSFYYFRKSSSLFESLGQKKGQASALSNMGTIYNRIGSFDSAAHYLFLSLKLAESINDKELQGSTLNSIGLVMQDQGRYDEAIDYTLRSVRFSEEAGKRKSVAMAFENLANTYQEKGELVTAKQYYDKAIESYILLEDKRGQARLNVNMSSLLREQGNYREAVSAALLSADLYKQIKNRNGTIHALLSLSETNYEIKNYASAAKYAQQALAIAIETGNQQMKLEDYKLLHKIYSAQGDYKSAYQYQGQAAALDDSLFNEKKETIISELQTKYETEKKENEIKLLSKDKELSVAKIRRQETLRNSMIAGVVLLLIIGALLFNRYRISQKHKQQAERMRISSDLHDEVGSTLSSISMISAFVANKISEKNNGEAQKLVEEISSSALQMGDDMNDIIWAINPHNDSFESIVNRLRNYASRMAESKNIALDFSAEENLLRENLPMGKRKNLYLICKEAVNNSVKYSGCKNLSIAFHKHKMYMHISVSDDGKGFDTQNNFEGNGLKNMKQRAQQMGSGFSIQSSPGSGVQIIIDIPNA